MIKINACHAEAGYIAAMKHENYEYFLFCSENNFLYNGSKVHLFKSKESAEDAAMEEFRERKRIYKIGKTFFVKENEVYLAEIHELKFDIPSLAEFLWKQPDDKMWCIVKQDGTIQTLNNGLPALNSEEVQAQSPVGAAIAKLCHYTADGKPVILEVKSTSQQQ